MKLDKLPEQSEMRCSAAPIWAVCLPLNIKLRGRARRRLDSASRAKIESTLEQLAASIVSYQGQVASGALEAWQHGLR